MNCLLVNENLSTDWKSQVRQLVTHMGTAVHDMFLHMIIRSGIKFGYQTLKTNEKMWPICDKNSVPLRCTEEVFRPHTSSWFPENWYETVEKMK